MSDAAGSTETLRRTLETSRDPRVGRTRQAIADAVRRLDDSGESISVTAITRAAGISRASFYSHYSGIDDLALAISREAFATIEALWKQDDDTPFEAMRRAQRRLVGHFTRDRGLYAAVAALPVARDTHLALVRAMAAVIEDALAVHPALPPGLQVEATSRYIAGAAVGLIDAWITGEIDLDEDALVDHLVRLLPSWFNGSVEPPSQKEECNT